MNILAVNVKDIFGKTCPVFTDPNDVWGDVPFDNYCEDPSKCFS